MSAFEATQFVPFYIGQQLAGYIHHEQLGWLQPYPEVFQLGGKRVELHPRLASPELRTLAVQAVVEEWVAAGMLKKREEWYDVLSHWGAPPLMRIMRGAHRIFGMLSFGVHVTGYQHNEQGLKLWVGERSKEKMTYPGKLDTFVAGGRSSGLLPTRVMVKECGEEAHIPPEIAKTARAVGAITYCRQLQSTLERDTMFVFELKLPGDCLPVPDQVEVADFHCLPAEEIYHLMVHSRKFKDNCHLVLIDFFIRHAFLSPDDPHYLTLLRGLHQSLFPPQIS